MADHAQAHAHGHEHHAPMYYIKIWLILLVLLVVSILGPMMEIKILTLITAFGIAIVKALIVAAYFMHLNIEKKFIWYMLFSMLILVGVFYVALVGDVESTKGQNWINQSALEYIERGQKAHNEQSGQHP